MLADQQLCGILGIQGEALVPVPSLHLGFQLIPGSWNNGVLTAHYCSGMSEGAGRLLKEQSSSSCCFQHGSVSVANSSFGFLITKIVFGSQCPTAVWLIQSLNPSFWCSYLTITEASRGKMGGHLFADKSSDFDIVTVLTENLGRKGRPRGRPKRWKETRLFG